MKILNKTVLAVSIVAAFSGNVMAADDTYRIDNRGQIVEDRVMYSLGGGAVVGAPASFYRPNGIGVGLKWKANMMCGNMSLNTTIGNQLNGITEGFKNIMGDIINAATGAVASLPAMIIQRANPGLYELLSNGVMQSRIDFDRSKLKCEELAKQLADYTMGSEWGEIAGAQQFQDSVNSGEVDAVTAVKDHEKKKGDYGVAWMGGSRAGGKGQDPIRVTEDIVKAGYNALHQRGETATGSVSDCKGGAVCSAWDNPEDAAEFAVRVLGESERQTCNDSCEPVKATAGVGLTPLIQEEYEKRLMALEDLIVGSAAINAENLAKVSSNMLPVTRGVIESLRDDPDREVLARRLASETAMSAVLEKGLLLLRTLQAGGRNPNVIEAKPAQDGNQQNIDALLTEIKSIQMEMEIRAALATNTAHAVLERNAIGLDLSRPIQSDDPSKRRFERTNTGE